MNETQQLILIVAATISGIVHIFAAVAIAALNDINRKERRIREHLQEEVRRYRRTHYGGAFGNDAGYPEAPRPGER